jgi:hypothetical protein
MTNFYRLWHWWLDLRGTDRANILIGVAGIIVIAGYTTVAAFQWCALLKANKLTRTIVAEQVASTRPVLMADGINPTDKTNSAVNVLIYNFGTTVATEIATAGTLKIAKKSGEPPVDPRCQPNGYPSQNIPTTALAPLEKSPKPGIASYYCTTWFSGPTSRSQPSADEALYAVGCIYYEGLDGRRWYGDICTMWTNGSYLTCPEVNRNFICERGTCREYRTSLSDQR